MKPEPGGENPMLNKKVKAKFLKKEAEFSLKQILVFAVVFGIIGGFIIYKSFASGFVATLEAENSTLSGAATIGSDSNASGGKYIQFGGSSSGGGSGGGSTNVTLPARAAFYYPWFPETWTVNGVHVFYNPLLGYYDSSSQTVVDSHIHALDYDGVKVAIASWWGQGTHSENTRIPLLLSETKALGSNLKWALYYEPEGTGDPTVTQIQSDLNYIKTNYASSPSYAYVNGKPVIFVYNANDTTCAVADKWAQANTGIGFYINLKVLSGYKTCTNQPDSWHQYGPATAEDSQTGYSFTISPGYWRADQTTPQLPRDPTRWQTNVTDMINSKAPWQLVTTFNEWGEGTAVEAAQEWSSTSGYGVYQDILHNTQ